MEPAVSTDVESLRDERVKVLKAILPLQPEDVLHGQFEGYQQEPGVAPGSKTETYAAVHLRVDSWRWAGVPFYIRAGKNLPMTVTEVIAKLKKVPQTRLLREGTTQNYVRFRISPEMTVALAASVTDPINPAGPRKTVEMISSRHANPQELEPYELVLSDAMAGDHSLFARQDYVEEAWRIVDPVLTADTPIYPYAPHTWGPTGVATSVIPPGGWHLPFLDGADDFRLVEPNYQKG